MLILQGHYQVAPNKRLTISAEPERVPRGEMLSDLEAIQAACGQGGGRCEVQVSTPNGLMRGTLVEKQSRQFHRRLFEGHLAFVPRA